MKKVTAPATLPETGFLRLRQVLQFIPIGPTRWYQGVKSGEFPAPIALAPRVKAYRVSDIRALIDRLNAQPPAAL
ncbi:MAG: AlpA family phage regulatory protein [Desulfovibrio sp.]|nr:AlpA family phage regulatory protein [Desulfovibrio sp.]